MKISTFVKMTLYGALMGAPLSAMAQADDPFSNEAKAEVAAAKPSTLKVVYEVFSLPMKGAAELQRSGISDKAFYAKMIAGLESKSVKQKSFFVLRGLSGQRMEGWQVDEYIYPTEYEPAELPNSVASSEGAEGGEEKDVFPVTPAVPSAFDTKLLGEVLEVEAVANEKFIDLRIVPSRVSLIQRDTIGQGVSKLELPRFSNPKLASGIVVTSGKPAYLGTVSDSDELQAKEGEKQVCFAFVTVTKITQ